MSTEKPLDPKPCPFCKATLERWGGYYACPNKACSFPLGIAPVESVPAPVGLDLEAALETERQRAEDDLEGARATGLSNAEQVSRARMMAYAHALTLARRAALSPRPATGADQGGATA